MLTKNQKSPLFRNPIGLFESMLSDTWQQPLFRQMARRFDKDLAWIPTLDVYEKEGALVLQGERREETNIDKESFYLAESSYGSFYRRLPLAFDADLDKIVAQ